MDGGGWTDIVYNIHTTFPNTTIKKQGREEIYLFTTESMNQQSTMPF
jgi:hypothetical protein